MRAPRLRGAVITDSIQADASKFMRKVWGPSICLKRETIEKEVGSLLSSYSTANLLPFLLSCASSAGPL
jgi:hypothetical protein